MKFRKALKEAVIKNKESIKEELERGKNMLLENYMSTIMNNWPNLIINQFNADNNPDPEEKEKAKQYVERNIKSIELDNNASWTGDFYKEFYSNITSHRFDSAVFKINGKDEILIICGMNKVYVNLFNSKTALKLYSRIKDILAKQIESARQEASSKSKAQTDAQPITQTNIQNNQNNAQATQVNMSGTGQTQNNSAQSNIHSV